jgi:hypothetical protein
VAGGDNVFLAYVDRQNRLKVKHTQLHGGSDWTIDIAELPHRHGYHVEDLDGLQIAHAVAGPPSGYVLARIDNTGTPPTRTPVMPANLPSPSAPPDAWARAAQSFPIMHQTGAIIIFQDWLPGGAQLKTACIDLFGGTPLSAVQTITSGGQSQELPAGTSTGLPAGSDSATIAWSAGFAGTVDGQDVWAQRVGCCGTQDPGGGIDIGPELPCGIPDAPPGFPWGQFAVESPFPASSTTAPPSCRIGCVSSSAACRKASPSHC